MMRRPESLTYYKPEIEKAKELLEITRDFTDPKEGLREAISNSMDWGATRIEITVEEDKDRVGEEVVIRVKDNGVGLNEERLHAFFALGRSTDPVLDDSGKPVGTKIGYKGHGTKTFFNSRQVEVWSDSADCTVFAIMDDPLQTLMDGHLPEYGCDIEAKHNEGTGTGITLRGYDANRSRKDFAHDVLNDYVLWFTRFGSVEKEFGVLANEDKVLLLQGLGRDHPERIEFGHLFPEENSNIAKLQGERPGDWTKVFVKRWLFEGVPVVDHPGKSIDMVFYIEGDEAKRSYNAMIRARGKTPTYGMYKVEDRYGLWACRDYIPIEQVNDWLGLGKRLETKYHAFVNCQDFRLTANRGDIGNTPPDFLVAVEETVKQIYEREIIRSREYQEYEESAELAQQYQTAQHERTDFGRRRERAKHKRVCEYLGVELIEPGVEMGVVALFNQIYALSSAMFPFRIIDYDTKTGYDALVAGRAPSDLSKASVYFIEFKYVLGREFNHSFEHLQYIICWDCDLSDGDEVTDIQDQRRVLRITERGRGSDYTTYMLVSATRRHNIEVLVLKDYLKERLDLEFRPRSGGDSQGAPLRRAVDSER